MDYILKIKELMNERMKGYFIYFHVAVELY